MMLPLLLGLAVSLTPGDSVESLAVRIDSSAHEVIIYSAAERLWGARVETGNFELPKSIGVPLTPGMPLGMYIAWHNSLGHDLAGVRLRIVMLWTPRNQTPRPVDVLPLYLDVNLTVGGANEFDVPPGRSERVHEFTVPTEGRILGLSGHPHDYGREIRLEDAETGKVLTRVGARSRADGTLRGMERYLFGISGEGLRLRAGHRYRVVAVYENPTGDTLVKAAMGSFVGIFAPRLMVLWPRLEPEDSLFKRDLRFLARRGNGMMTASRQPQTPMMMDSMPMTQQQHHAQLTPASHP